ncbi:hypothetical protein [Mycolicibacterium arenosum]|uniref:Uncharacterized protein n=1 Tax=Mycolicibacterium arenosum TaxID=2952157 RepID=A0ABT1M1W8_9MYCO|nr:hypothetical protein [Mycolicibacterium sp. CAU 1645]MCP9272870.1 hypothetical protein [Mycolicibacterium sp. CAU 1645]
MTDMRMTMGLVGAAFMLGSTAMVAPTASAEPVEHDVVYNLSVTGPGSFQVYYAYAAPPSKAAYDADPNAYTRSETVVLDPAQPWVLPVKLTDPNAAFISVSRAGSGLRGDSNPTCAITIDGAPGPTNTGPIAAQCELRSWSQPW